MNTLLLRPLLPAFATGRPRPRQARLTHDKASARVAGRPDVPLPVAAALVAGGLDGIRLGARAAPRSSQPRSASARWAVVGGIGVGLSLAIFLASQQALRGLPPLPSWDELSSSAQLPADPTNSEEAAAGAEAPPSEPNAADRQSIEAAINGELRRHGAGRIEVKLADDGSMRVTGQAASTTQRDAVLQWLRSLPGAGEIEDAVSVARPATTAPALDAARNSRANAESVTPPMPLPEAAPLPRASPPPPDAGHVARALRSELARLGLTEVAVDVDPSNLDITLRGKTSSNAAKSQLLAAARAAAPGSRVRDLVFVIEE